MFKFAGVLTPFILLQSCISIPQLHEFTISDIVPIHNNPRVGDYAVTVADDNVMSRKEVVKVTEHNITYREHVTFIKPEDKEYNTNSQYYKVIDRNGNVLKAWVHYESGKQNNVPIAKPGESASIQNYAKVNINDTVLKKHVLTKAGRLKVDNIYTYFQDFSSISPGLPGTNISMVEYRSNVVPFQRIRLESYIVPDKDAFIYSFIKANEYLVAIVESYINQSPMALYNVATKERNYNLKSTLDLVEYGFAK